VSQESDKLRRVTGTDRHQVVRIIHVHAADHNAAIHKAFAIATRANRRALLRPNGGNSQTMETLPPDV
jgi:hypothetical protein